MRWFQNTGLWVRRQMAGRYGVDALGRALAIGGLVLLILAMLTQRLGGGLLSALLGMLAFVAILWNYIRFFSRNIPRRAAENQKYRDLVDGLRGWLCLRKECFAQRKDYCFFRCPSCRRLVRVPKGKGRIRITCRQCGFAFEKKT